MQKGSEPQLDVRMGEGSACMRCLAPLAERWQGQSKQKHEAMLWRAQQSRYMFELGSGKQHLTSSQEICLFLIKSSKSGLSKWKKARWARVKIYTDGFQEMVEEKRTFSGKTKCSLPTLKIKELLHEGCPLSPPPLACRAPEGTCTPDPRDGVADGVPVRWVRVTVGWHPAGWHGVGYKIRTTDSVADNGRILIVLLSLVLLSLRPGLLSVRGMLPTIPVILLK